MNSITLIPYLKYYSECGFNSSAILSKFNLLSEQLNKDFFVPSFLTNNLISTIERCTGINDIGVAAYLSGDFNQVHPEIAEKMNSTQNLLEILFILKTHRKLQGSHFDLHLQHDNGTLLINHFSSIPKNLNQYTQNEHLRTLSIIEIIRQKIGSDWKPECLFLSSDKSPPIEIIKSTTSGKVYTNQKHSCIPVKIDLDRLSDELNVQSDIVNNESTLEHLKTITKIFIEHEELSLTLISDMFGCSQRTLQRILKKHDINYREFIKVQKLEHAVSLLKQNHPINLVASKIGYNEPANFTRAFKAHFGVAPSMYNNIHQKNIEQITYYK